MIPAPSPVLLREGYLTDEDIDAATEDAVKGYGEHIEPSC